MAEQWVAVERGVLGRCGFEELLVIEIEEVDVHDAEEMVEWVGWHLDISLET